MVTPARRSKRKSAPNAKASPAPSSSSLAGRSSEPRAAKRKAGSQVEQPTPPPAKKVYTEPPKNKPTPDFSNAPPRYEGKLSKRMEECKKIVDSFYGSRMEKYELFYAPVDVEALNLPDYYDVVETPMDLQTVKDKLKYLQYANAEEFAEDMRLIGENCIKYNGPDSDYGKIAANFLKSFELKYDRLPEDRHPKKHVKPEPTTSFAASTPSNMSLKAVEEEKKVDAVDDDGQLESLINQMEAESAELKKRFDECNDLKQELYNLKTARMDAKLNQEVLPQLSSERHSAFQSFFAKSSISTAPMVSTSTSTKKKRSPTEEATEAKPVAVVAPQASISAAALPRRGRKKGSKNKKKKDGYTFDSSDEESQEPMTYEEKRELSLKVDRLSADVDVLVKVLDIIRAREALEDVNPEEIEVDFETLKPVTLRELEVFVAAIDKKNNPKSKKTRRPAGNNSRKKKPEDQITTSNDTQDEPSSAVAESNQATNGGQNDELANLALSESSSDDSDSSDDEAASAKDKAPSSKPKSTVKTEEVSMMPAQNDARSFSHSHPTRPLPPSNDENARNQDVKNVNKQQKISRPQATVKPSRPAVARTNVRIDPLDGLFDDPPTTIEKSAVSEPQEPSVDLRKSIELMANFDADF